MLTQYCILIAEMQIYGFVLSHCLPLVQIFLKNHQNHEPDDNTHCPCYTLVPHSYKEWILNMVLKIEDLLSFKASGFSISSEAYLPGLPSPSIYEYCPPRNSIKHSVQKIMNIFKDTLYTWLGIPSENLKKSKYCTIIVGIFCKYLGPASLFLPTVWKLCQAVPQWVYTDGYEYSSRNI